MKNCAHTCGNIPIRETIARGVKALRELTVIALDDALVKVLPDEMEIIPFKELARAIGFDKDIWNADGG